MHRIHMLQQRIAKHLSTQGLIKDEHVSTMRATWKSALTIPAPASATTFTSTPIPNPRLCHCQSSRRRLPKRLFPQRGSNCRQVALGNVLRLPREPSMKDMEPYLLQLTTHQLPQQLGELKRHLHQHINVSEWTRGWAAFAGLMTQFVEAKWTGVMAIQLSRVQWPRKKAEDQRDTFAKAFDGTRLCDVQTQDAESPGFVYFTKTHCMSCLQDENGQWWNVPQSSASKIPPHVARTKFQRAMGVVAILSFREVALLIRNHLQTALQHCPLFLARAAQLILRPTMTPHVRELFHYTMQTPKSVWSNAARIALQSIVTQWWSPAPSSLRQHSQSQGQGPKRVPT